MGLKAKERQEGEGKAKERLEGKGKTGRQRKDEKAKKRRDLEGNRTALKSRASTCWCISSSVPRRSFR